MGRLFGLFVLGGLCAACGGGSVTGTNGTGGTGGNGGGGGSGGPVATTSVTLRNSAFAPPAILVSPGTVVTFTNSDGIAHNVSFASSAIANIPNWTSGSRNATMPTTPGTYGFQCTLHAGMSGSVQVQ